MLVKRIVTLTSLALIIAACASGSGAASASDPSTPSAARRGGMGPITQADLSDPEFASASLFDAVRLLRPGFFSARGAVGGDAAQSTVVVSIDGSAFSPLSTLNSVLASQVAEVRYLSAIDAAQRFGTTSTGGPVLLVTMRKR